MIRVHLTQGFDPRFVTQLSAGLHPAIDLTCGDESAVPQDYEVLIAGRPTREQLTVSPRLKTLIIPWAGLPARTRDLLLGFSDLTVYNIHHNADPTAETALALLLAAAKGVILLDRALRHHDWTPRYHSSRNIMLAGKTALVLGYGHVGRRVAEGCRGLRMKVIAAKRQTTGRNDGDIRLVDGHEWRSWLPRAQTLIVALPLTYETERLVGASELADLPEGAIVVNVSRGPVVGEEALYRELSSGRLRAGLDVWYYYPADEESRSSTPPSNFPFHELNNVVMTPHVAGNAVETESLRIAELQKLLNLIAIGKPLPNRVDVRRGY